MPGSFSGKAMLWLGVLDIADAPFAAPFAAPAVAPAIIVRRLMRRPAG